MNQRKEIKGVIEQILGSNITMRFDGTTEEDKLKNEFIEIIKLYENVWKRQSDIDIEYGADFSTYDEPFFKLIEKFIHFSFDEIAGSAIIFYIYGRKSDEGEIYPFIDSSCKEHIFNTIDDLWDFLMYWAEEMMKL